MQKLEQIILKGNDGSDCLEIVPKLFNIYDEPFSDLASIPTVLLSNFAKNHVSVILSGDGADELLCG